MATTQNTVKPTIRPMKPTDLDAVYTIEQAASIDPWSQSILASCLQRYFCTVIEVDHIIAGFAIFANNIEALEILNIAVKPSYQQQGLGRLLIKDVIETACDERINQVFLEVRKSNLKAQSLYQKMGFKVVGHRKDYYATPEGKREDALLMTWSGSC